MQGRIVRRFDRDARVRRCADCVSVSREVSRDISRVSRGRVPGRLPAGSTTLSLKKITDHGLRFTASAVSNSHRIRHFHTIAHPVSQNGSPERSPLPPRVVPVTGYTGLCADCLRAAVTSHGSRRRAASGSSSRHRRTSDESFMRTLARHASRRL